MENAEENLRKLDERSVPRRRASLLYTASFLGDVSCSLAPVPNPDKALREAIGTQPSTSLATPNLDGRER